IENFLEKNSSLIKGRVLEVADNEYTTRFGQSNVIQSDILHVNDNNPKATIIADLGESVSIADNSFDCIILTQTLQFIYNYRKAIENCHRILKPDGNLLLTVPGITHLGKEAWNWYWSFTSFSITKILSEYFDIEYMKVQTFGNVLVATAFLYGMGQREIKEKEFNFVDPSYQVIITAAAKKLYDAKKRNSHI
ncbi:MAG: class I SAM-dependent methyltransferase, partial [Bacteroidota bacterium]|nr:class I SAM-dependent methyltransferase [Bacteroidota bacterium]